MRCMNCRKGTDGTFCDVGCAQEYDAYTEMTEKYGWVFLVLVISEVLLGPVLWQFVSKALSVSIVLVAIGMTVFVLPLATPQTVRSLGTKRSMLAARMLGIILMASGIALLTLRVL